MNSASDEELKAARGVLRFEIRLRDNRSCNRHAEKIGACSRTVEALLNNDVAQRTVRTTLNHLGLDRPLSSGSRRLELLRSQFPNDRSKVVRLMGFLSVCDYYGADNVVDLGFCSYSDFRRKLADVKKAGVFYQTNGPVTLAPLTALQSPKISSDSQAA